jgi:hypothetical protein
MANTKITSRVLADDAVLTANIADDQVTLAKMAGLARGKIIYGDSSGNPAALAVGSNGQVLKSDGTDIAWGTDSTVAALTSEEVQDIVGAMFSSNTETGITATYQDGDGTVDLVVGTLNQDTTGTAATVTGAAQSAITSLGTLTTLTVDDITINGSTISDGGTFGIDAGGNIELDADGGQIIFVDGGTNIGRLENSSSDFVIKSMVDDKDIIFKGEDDGSGITALTLDMSDAGAAQFNSRVGIGVASHATAGLNITNTSQHIRLNNGSELGIINLDSDGILDLWAHGDGESMTFRTGTGNGTVAMSVVGTDVGIGTTSPAQRLHIKSSGAGTYPIRIDNSEDTDMLFGVYESSDGDGNNGMLYLNDGAGNTDVKISTNGDSYFNGGKLAIGADHADEPLTVRSSGENVNCYLIEVGNDLHASNTKDAWIKYVGGAATTDHSWTTGIVSDRFKIIRLGARGTAPDSGDIVMEFASTGTAHLGMTSSDMRLYLGSQGGAFGANSSNNLRPVGTAFYQNSGGANFVFERAGTGVGYIDASGFNDGSDEALKKNIADLTYGLDTVKSLKPRKFKWKSNSEDAIGFIAQEVESIVPEIVSESNPEGTLTSFKGLSYGHLTAVLVKALQEADDKIDALETRIKTLEDA